MHFFEVKIKYVNVLSHAMLIRFDIIDLVIILIDWFHLINYRLRNIFHITHLHIANPFLINKNI